MAEKKPETPKTPETTGTTEQAAEPAFHILHQYIKDLSFEVPNGPAIFTNEGLADPDLNINVNTGVDKVGDNEFAVEITIQADAKTKSGDQIYLLELVYGGVAHVSGFDEEQLPPLIMIEVPRLLFPFARNLVSKTTEEGGFVSLMMQPIDFVDLYQQQIAAMVEAQENEKGQDSPAEEAKDSKAKK